MGGKIVKVEVIHIYSGMTTAAEGTDYTFTDADFFSTVTGTVTAVTVSSDSTEVTKGGTLAFTATVTGENNPSQTVTWDVDGENDNGTTINASGILTVAAGETATSLTVRATSTVDVTKSGTATVTVKALVPTVTAVTVSPNPAETVKSGTRQFTATVTGENNPSQTVTWDVEGENDNGTTINASGILTVAAGETATSLTVRATSTVDATKSGTATVTVKDPVVFIGTQGYESLEAAVTAALGTTATITVKADINAGSITVDTGNTQITLEGDTTERIITGTASTRFTMGGSGSSLTLADKITLYQGGVTVNSGATLVLKTGAKITGVIANSGVRVHDHGTFTMEGGSIENNGDTYNSSGGVAVSGTFTMTGGSIKGNKAMEAGGVFVDNHGIFIMEGGSIENNEASDIGGGVYVYGYGTFTMKNSSVIKGNKSNGNGGGVFVDSLSTFIMENGSIEGNTASFDGKGGGVYLDFQSVITKTGGTIYGSNATPGKANGASAADRGAAVYVHSFIDGCLAHLEKTVSQNLSKALQEDTASELTPANGWTE
ncbi:MAG: hypothetical protein LBD78_01715 [Spirochaetaceae bacterium]|jgi:hypothetical protein|nr:hypothetical protein [Spirochaetaceae bacterium]